MADFYQGDYEYTIISGTYTVKAKVRDTSKSSYDNIPSSISYNGNVYTVISLHECFKDCSITSTSLPNIPNTVKYMDGCFIGATLNLETNIIIPEGVQSMICTFYNTHLIVDYIYFPTTLIYMNNCFEDCSGTFRINCIPTSVKFMNYCFLNSNIETLSTTIRIAANPTESIDCFEGTSNNITLITSTDSGNRNYWKSQSFSSNISISNDFVVSNNGDYNIYISGYPVSCSVNNLYQTNYKEIPTNIKVDNTNYIVSSLNECFEDCVNLINSPKIPNTITNLFACFEGCINLEGLIIVENTYVDNYEECFDGTSKNIYICSTNKSNTWKNIANDYNNVFYIEPKGDFIYLPLANNKLNVRTFNDDAEYLSPILSNIEINNTEYNTTSMDDCFYNMHNLKSISIIPSYITSMNRTFYDCDSLSGTIHVYNNPTSYTDIFYGTENNIFVIPHSQAIKSKWETIARSYSNVKVLNEPIVDIYQGDTYSAISFGGYDEDENKIVSYLDFVGENSIYISSDDLSMLIDDLNWNEVEI